MSILQILPALEVLVFNLLTLDRCSHKKYSAVKTIVVLAAFSLAFLSVCLLADGYIPFRGDGSLSLAGMIYLIPLKYLYKEKPLVMVVVVCTAWSYTLGVLTLSIQIADVVAGGSQLFVLFAETILFMISVFPFYRWIVSKYVFVLENLDSFEEHWPKYMALSSCLYFLVLVGLNNVMVMEKGTPLKILVLAVLLAAVCVTHFMIYEIMLDTLKMNRLERTAMYDSLTGLGNRAQLWEHLQGLLREDRSFSVLFMDLDKFKIVNDQYGHMVGDQYLKHFAQISSRTLQGIGMLYRFGGDEFVAVCDEIVPQYVVDRLRECGEWETGAPCPFNSVSAGVLYCKPPHKGVEQILQQVDRLMYENKLRKNAGADNGRIEDEDG